MTVEHCLTDDVYSFSGHFGSLVFEDLDHRFALVLEDLVLDVDAVSDDLLARHPRHLVVHRGDQVDLLHCLLVG